MRYGAIWAPRAPTGGAHATAPIDGPIREDCNYKSTETDRPESSFDLMKIMFPLSSDTSEGNDLDVRRRACLRSCPVVVTNFVVNWFGAYGFDRLVVLGVSSLSPEA